MFTDLVGSTARSTKLDPEDLRSVIGAYHRCVSETTARFDGFVAKYIGDGVLIYFGYPHAHEDDALKAKITKHGWFSQEAIAARKEQRAVLRALKAAAKKLALVPILGHALIKYLRGRRLRPPHPCSTRSAVRSV
jgi:class 3 adenylate cyclase